MKKPTIVCLCGSSRFYKEYQIAEYQETMAGRIYLSIGFYPHAAEEMHGEGVGHNSYEKVALDELHKRKIDLADEVLVLNVGGYIGDSTKSEVAYALDTGKPVRWLEPDSAWSPVRYKQFLIEEEITASRAALAISASIGSGGDCPDKWVLEYALAKIESRLKAIKSEKLICLENGESSHDGPVTPGLG